MSDRRSGPSRRWPRRWARSAQGALPRRSCRASRSTAARIGAGRGVLRASRATAATAMTSSPAALQGRRRACGGRRRQARRDCRRTRRCWSCRTCSKACAISRAPRARAARRKFIGVTGSVGKTGTKEALRLALSRDGETHASAASYNNHWGVPLSLARCPAERALRGVRDRHEPRRRDRAADAAGAPACRDRHHDRAGASGILRLGRGDRRRQGGNLRRASSRAARR